MSALDALSLFTDLLKESRQGLSASPRIWWRGQSDDTWKLVPKVYRGPFYQKDPHDIFEDWRRQAVAHKALPDNFLEQLAIAQHHGLATPLLDWSLNPLVALYFAVNTDHDLDGVVCGVQPDPQQDQFLVSDPVRAGENAAGGRLALFYWIPPSHSPRILQQRGVFTYHGKQRELSELRIRKVIPSRLKQELLCLLSTCGVDRASLFPDLDGLSYHINWMVSGS